jgi:hypothetical protein
LWGVLLVNVSQSIASSSGELDVRWGGTQLESKSVGDANFVSSACHGHLFLYLYEMLELLFYTLQLLLSSFGLVSLLLSSQKNPAKSDGGGGVVLTLS